MSVQMLCMRCPYFHPVGQDCPPGWHDVQSAGGGDGSGGGRRPLVKVALVVGLVGAVLLAVIEIALVVTASRQGVAR